TLDPLASGLLGVVLGEATKLAQWLQVADKTYLADIKLGETTTTLDSDGDVVESKAVEVSRERVEEQVSQLNGDFDWPIPFFSAKKVGGEELYKKAYRGEAVPDLPLKKMSFFDVSLREYEKPHVQVKLSCEKGGFIRTWADQMGKALGVGAHLTGLRRLRVGRFEISQACDLKDLEEGRFEPAFFGFSELVRDWKTVRVNSKEEKLMENGQVPFDLQARLIPEQKEVLRSGQEQGVRVCNSEGQLRALLMIRPGQGIKILRVFKLDPDAFSH
ncbi:MAG TPA: tRNA pseudouridine(55) synthase TruB, partial [Bdellovibrionales bacterium]|nr:tRNA pseudouridine(55) synthase TruB [Bdellovibrionales bacterium]